MSRPFDDPILLRLWDHWQSVRAGQTAPHFDDISMAALGPAAEHVMVIERLGPRFRYLSVGDAIRRIYGYPMDRVYLDTVVPEDLLARAAERYARVCDSGRPALARNAYEITAGLGFYVQRLILPLAQEHGSIGGVICGQVMQKASGGPAGQSHPSPDSFEFLDVEPPLSPET